MKQIIFSLLTACCMTAKGQYIINTDDSIRVVTKQYNDSVVQSKCQHIYVAVVQPEIEVTIPAFTFTGLQIQYGKRDGIDIVCLKCIHRRKQVVDYGLPQGMGLATPDTMKLPPHFTEPGSSKINLPRTSDTLLLRVSELKLN
jgi:hypothetical protein